MTVDEIELNIARTSKRRDGSDNEFRENAVELF